MSDKISARAEDPNWRPSRDSKYYNCMRWRELKESCPLAKAVCSTCTFFDPPQEGPGRPNFTGVNWQDPIERDRYGQEKYVRERKRKLLRHFKSTVVRAAGDRVVEYYVCPHCKLRHPSSSMVIKFDWQGCRTCNYRGEGT